jgi:hypothetical protein
MYSLLESILFVDSDFLQILTDINNIYSSRISNLLLNIVGEDIKTNINYLKPSDKNDDIKFINDTQVDRIIASGNNPFNDVKNTTKIGRAIRQILTLNNISFTDKEIEDFVNNYKNIWDNKYTDFKEGFSLIKGDSIKYWYLLDNYYKGGGSLNNSCMRYQNCQSYFDIYTKNPEVCSLLIYKDSDNKLLGRALVWTLVQDEVKSKYYLDRIYTRFDSDIDKFKKWFIDNLNDNRVNYESYNEDSSYHISVKLKKWKFEKYPYMDTFTVLDIKNGILKKERKDDDVVYFLSSTEGDFNTSHKWSEYNQDYILNRYAVFLNDDWYHYDQLVKTKDDEYELEENCVYSDKYNSYVRKEDAVEFEGDIVDKKDIVEVYDDLINGKPANKKKVLYSENNKIYVLFKEKYVNKKNLIYRLKYDQWVLEKDEDELIVYNININDFDSITSELEAYYVYDFVCYFITQEFDILESRLPIFVKIKRSVLASENVLKALNINYSNFDKTLIDREDYYNNFIHFLDLETKKQLNKDWIKNPNYIISDIKDAIDYFTKTDLNEDLLNTFSKNKKLISLYKESDGDLKKGLIILLSNFLKEKKLLKKLYDNDNMKMFISQFEKRRGEIYFEIKGQKFKLNEENIKKFITHNEYYIICYIYLYIFSGERRSSYKIIEEISDINVNNNRNTSEEFLSYFTYTDTYKTLAEIIHYDVKNFEFYYKIKDIESDDRMYYYDIFYENLKS